MQPPDTGHAFPFHRYGIDEFAYREYVYVPLDEWLSQTCRCTPDLVILGDFNTGYAEALLPNMYRYATPLLSGLTRPNGRADDYIFCTNPSAVRRVRVVSGPFDHFLCLAEMDFYV